MGREETVLSSFEAARALLEAVPDAVIAVSHERRIVMANRLAERLFGYAPGAMLGLADELLVPPRHRDRHAQLGHGYLADPRSRPSGESVALVGCRVDGAEFPIEMTMSTLSAPDGAVVICIIRDVSARRQAEAKYRALLESAPDAIVVVDGGGTIALANGRAEAMFGYSRRELVGQPVELLLPERHREIHVAERNVYARDPKLRPMGVLRPLHGRRRDGSEFPVEVSLSPLETDEGFFVTSVVRDISARQAAEEKIRASLREKEVLLKEIHHRVKNNLQVVSSLLKMQAAAVQDGRARELFEESRHRIRSMALVHELLYGSKDLSSIDVLDYLRRLSSLLVRSFGLGDRVRLHVEGDPLRLGVDAAVPCGILANELVSNCLKHAFPGGRRGTVTVTLRGWLPTEFTLSVRDDGVGIAELDPSRAETLGLSLVHALADQLHGRLEVLRAGGTEVRLLVGDATAAASRNRR